MLLRDLRARVEAIDAGGPLDTEVTSVTRDSREAGSGALFVAIRGGKLDGHALIPDLPGGAVIIDVDAPAPAHLPWLRVRDTRRALALASSAVEGDPALQVPVIGVTGTNGKTTITTLIQQAVELSGGVAGRIGTTGVEVGGRAIPSSLTTPEAPVLHRWFRAMREAGAELIAMEVSSIGLVQQRVAGIPYHVAVFTNLGHDHLDFHGTFEAYAAAKALLFTDHLRPAGEHPRAVLCGDDPHWPSMQPPDDRWLYGFDAHNDVCIRKATLGADGTLLELTTPIGDFTLTSPLVGRFNALNLAAAFSAGVLAGVPAERMIAGLALSGGAPGRLERVPTDRGMLVLVDYAHTPDALEAAIRSVRAAMSPGASLIVVFGCGGDRDRAKRPVMGAASLAADHVVVTSDNPRSESPASILDDIVAGMSAQAPGQVDVIEDRDAAIGRAIGLARPGDVVLIAGKGHERTQDVGGVLHPFDDRQVATKWLGGGA